jgi:hypothetical protein
MLNQRFYWGTIRKAIVAFGNMFNNIVIDRRDLNGNVIQNIAIPLAYAPKQKILARIEQQPDVDINETQIVLPRMSFEMVSLSYDPNRKIAPIQQSRALNNTNNTLNTQYAPTPYNIGVVLYIYAKNQDDGLQIVEQILPYFNPDYNLTLKAIPVLNIKNDLPIILDSITFEDDYEGDLFNRRSIIWTLNFTMKLNFYGPVLRQGFIRTAKANTYTNLSLTEQQQLYTVTTDPNTVMPGNTFVYLENFEEF